MKHTGRLTETDDVFSTLGNALNPGNKPTGKNVLRVVNELMAKCEDATDTLDPTERVGVYSKLAQFLQDRVLDIARQQNTGVNEADTIGDGDVSEPIFVRQAREIVKSGGYGRITDPVSKKRIMCDYGTARLIMQAWDSDAITPDIKQKFFKLPIQKIVNFLWSRASFKG